MAKIDGLKICTTTFYGKDEVSRVRQMLALKLFKNAADLGIPIVCVDGGSNEEFLGAARTFENVELRVEPQLGMGESRREAFRMAGADKDGLFLWVEPEKDQLVCQASLEAIIQPLKEGAADIVVPARKSLETLPNFQAWIEQRANQKVHALAARTARQEVWDLWFGPKCFNRAGGSYFLGYTGKLDKWDSILKPVLDAYRVGVPVRSVVVDYSYDETQKAVEDGNRVMTKKRVEQYVSILAEMGDTFCQNKVQKH